jgi:hypothetical protein
MSKALTENQLRYLVRSKLRMIVEKSDAGSNPEENYSFATRKNMHLDKPMMIGGWPEGEYEPPVQDRLVKWYKDMGLMDTKED